MRHVERSVYNSNAGGADVEFRCRRTAGNDNTYCYALILSEREAEVAGANGNLSLTLV